MTKLPFPLKEITGFFSARDLDRSFLLVGLLCRNDFPAFIEAAIWTNNVRKNHGTAIGAGYQIGGFQCIMRTPAVTTAF
jgi:hypothetical protein